ncbi:hypothetical protein MMC07_004127 [Pseudocyphellaria aurata]|nr:hypothetical protein [Pseudocyphellaria aurata]
MVCAKCQKLQKKTELATPGVKRRNEMYYGSPASSTTGASDTSKTSATLGATGIGKVSKPLRSHDETKTESSIFTLRASSSAKVQRTPTVLILVTAPLARRKQIKGESSVIVVRTRRMVSEKSDELEQHVVAGADEVSACAMCGKSQSKEASTGKAPIVQGQRFSAK